MLLNFFAENHCEVEGGSNQGFAQRAREARTATGQRGTQNNPYEFPWKAYKTSSSVFRSAQFQNKN